DVPSEKLLAALQERVPREVHNGWSLYVADDGGQLVAMLAINIPQLYLDQLMIAPSHQGRSLGRRLLAFTRELLPDEVWLRCAEGNAKAWRWYEREGFVLERSEEHTSELQSHLNLVCRLLLEKKKQKKNPKQEYAIIR